MGRRIVNGYVWYCSYGSNLSRDRMMCYIQGGKPNGGSREYAGCTDKTAPLEDRVFEIPGELYFAGRSKVWGGGMGFVDHTKSYARTVSRAYLITAEQFMDVAKQENWTSTQELSFRMIDEGAIRLTPQTWWHKTMVKRGRRSEGSYDLLWMCGEIDGVKAYTFTSPTVRPRTVPSKAYTNMIATGLAETCGWGPVQSAAYLRGAILGDALNWGG